MWKDQFDSNLYFSHGKPNLCGAIIGFTGNKNFTAKKPVWWKWSNLDDKMTQSLSWLIFTM